MKQAFLFTDADNEQEPPPFHVDARDDSQECACEACRGSKLEVVCERTGAHPDCPTDELGNHCTLEGKPARVIGRSFHYATIEPLDGDAEPIRCCWDIVRDILENCDRAFVRDDDDTDEYGQA